MSDKALAGTAVLQIIPAMRPGPDAHAAMDIAVAVLREGGRAIVAGEDGPLVGELRGLGGEYVPLRKETFNPIHLRATARFLNEYVLAQRIDIVHAHSAAGAWSALAAINELPVWLVTSLPAKLAKDTWFRRSFHGVLARGDRVIAPSSHVCLAAIERYTLPPQQTVVIPRSVDTAVFSLAAIPAERISTVRRLWGVLPDTRVIVVPGRLTPAHGHATVIDAARLIAETNRNLTIVFVGDDRADAQHTRKLRKQARDRGVDTLIRFAGPSNDMPAVYAAADIIVVPALGSVSTSRAIAEAQAMGRPVIASATGDLPENILSPPRMADELRTGWLVRPGDVGELVEAIRTVSRLNTAAYAALSARARQFAEHVFSRRSVAEAVRGVYTSLRAGGA